MREADTAMYVAKGEGRDRVSVFNEELRAAVTTRLGIEGDLRHALERGQLAVWYQPEVDLTTGDMIAVEALLRWHHPSGELYGADRFVDVAEETGLILDIGDWVLRQACLQAPGLGHRPTGHAAHRPRQLSALQLADTGLLRQPGRRARRQRPGSGRPVRGDHRDGAPARDADRARQPRRHPRTRHPHRHRRLRHRLRVLDLPAAATRSTS